MKIAIVYYSMYGHIKTMADKVKEGALSVDGAEVTLYQIQETLPAEVLEKMHAPPKPEDVPIATPETLGEADCIIFGIPTRFGNVPAQVKAFFDSCGGLWQKGALLGKPCAMFVSTGTLGGGQEVTPMSALPFLVHQGMIFIPFGYQDPAMFGLDEVHGGSPWGPGTFAGADGSRMPSEIELSLAQKHGAYVASKAMKLCS